MKIRVLMISGLKSILRDKLLLFSLFLPILLSVLMRFLIPFVADLLREFFDFSEYYGLVQGVILLMWPMMLGWLGGFLLLDERDEGTLQSVAVTTGGKGLHLAARFSVILILGTVLSLIFLPLTNLFPVPFGRLLPLILVNTLLAPVYLLALPAFAENKVEGLVVAKTFSLTMLPAFAVLLPTPFCHFGAIFPTYFLTQAMLNNDSAGKFTIYLLLAFVEILLLTWIFFRRFQKDSR